MTEAAVVSNVVSRLTTHFRYRGLFVINFGARGNLHVVGCVDGRFVGVVCKRRLTEKEEDDLQALSDTGAIIVRYTGSISIVIDAIESELL